MTKKSDSTFTPGELDEYRDLAKTKFRKTPPLPKIDYQSRVVGQHLWMANIARSWLEKSKTELRRDLGPLIGDPDVSTELREAMIAAQRWFSDNAELMQAAISRSTIVAAASLVESIDRDGDHLSLPG